jgi:16S rRNA U516 pseudouridylate synthase RsuA-like enzyme
VYQIPNKSAWQRRLDKDTTGLLLLTTITGLVHKLTSPKNHVPKTYTAVLASPVEAEQQQDMVRIYELPALTTL